MNTSSPPAVPSTIPAAELRELLIGLGADDAGVVSIDRAELDDQREDILRALPRTRTLISFVVKMNREPIRSQARSLANSEFHQSTDECNHIARRAVEALELRGVRALAPPTGFPMEMQDFPGKVWVVSHKPVAVAAGLGRMGIHRNVIHPRFGNFVLLGTILLDREVDEQGRALDGSPCVSCKLCVAACPVGAISPEGRFDFSACYHHNYREFMGGFTDWVESIAASRSARAYRETVSDSDTASMWQSLSFGANYKAAYCMAVCPAGEDVISPFTADRRGFLEDVLRPLQARVEDLYVVPGTDAEQRARKRFPHKRLVPVGNGLRPSTVDGFLRGLPIVFQPDAAGDLDAVYHFEFRGASRRRATITVREGEIEVLEGLHGRADLHVWADATTWTEFLRGNRSLIWALVTRRIRLRGDPRLLARFGKCFPGS